MDTRSSRYRAGDPRGTVVLRHGVRQWDPTVTVKSWVSETRRFWPQGNRHADSDVGVGGRLTRGTVPVLRHGLHPGGAGP